MAYFHFPDGGGQTSQLELQPDTPGANYSKIAFSAVNSADASTLAKVWSRARVRSKGVWFQRLIW